jgi:dolichol-phosphate mannosyltransferase
MKKETVMQFFRFAIVGVINTLINLAVLYILTDFLKIYYLISAVFAFLVAVTNSFILNKIWTFKENMRDKTTTKYSKFFIISILALLINLAILYLLTSIFHIYYLISQIIAIGISLWINFFGNKLWTFKR